MANNEIYDEYLSTRPRKSRGGSEPCKEGCACKRHINCGQYIKGKTRLEVFGSDGPKRNMRVPHLKQRRDNPKNKSLKTWLLDSGIPNECVWCGLGTIWNDKPLVLQLDHIDGDKTNGDMRNLRFLCPNCHTQTSTWAGRRR